jgi:ankyrin repeat protein
MRKDIDEVQLFPCEHTLCLHCMIDLQADTLKFQSKAICCKDCGEQVDSFTQHRLNVTRKRTRDEEVQNQQLNEKLIQAMEDRNIPSVRNLLRSGANVNVKDDEDKTPLHSACWSHGDGHGPVELVKELVSAGADIEAKDNGGWTPLHYASFYGNLEISKMLVSAGADISAVNNSGNRPMDEALRGEESDVFKYLMKGFYAPIFEHEGRLPLHALLEDESLRESDALNLNLIDTDDLLEIIAFLVGKNPGSLSARNQGGELPLHVACATHTSVEIIRFLVDQAPQSILMPRTTDGAYPLHAALERGASLDSVFSDSDVIKMLLERHDPVTIMLRNNAGETPLHVACRCGVPFEIVESLVHHYKASSQVVTPQGDLPLFLACATAEPSLDIIYLLLKIYPDVVYP